jgi:hypothetical protein
MVRRVTFKKEWDPSFSESHFGIQRHSLPESVKEAFNPALGRFWPKNRF